MESQTSPEEILRKSGITDYLTKTGVAGEMVRDMNGCIIWPLGKTTGGYGMWYPEGSAEYVYRSVHQAMTGQPIPDGWHVDHVWERGCRSRACFWPEHLEAVTPEENFRRAGLARRQQGPRPCGHSWDDDRPGRSDCAACHREEEVRRKAPIRAANAAKWAARTEQIKNLNAAGLSRQEIAVMVGCSTSTVVRTLRGEGKRYRQLPGR